jgi:hypothetical protein
MDLTVSAGANHSATLTITQNNPAGYPTLTTTCYGTGTAGNVQPPTSSNQGINGGVLTATLSPYIGAVVGSCSITITPPVGTALVIPVTVGP